ncbi:MAG: tRNA(Ile)-lysidine synthase [Candidatus Ordinivivax streblomastigis]|uniref:tRNA(Ile)-lysidine synthase n=1 Tax=Candidatus Ordinivivax streblomastigis TaxID=2540710 RepID=A0A5M8P0I6_9BACT|nr:MAG: tRNA(Ile)-lysidine synthase [Candidatus Ordinivivax streblomastigis]
MIRKIRQYIEAQNLCLPETKIIVGLSGGADSVVLLYALQRLGYSCVAAHCDFHLRGEESFRDEQSACTFAASLQIPFLKTDFDTLGAAHQRAISIEMAARDLRYEWFEHIRQEQQADVIAVAHHRDDSIETMLLNLIRGTGIKGLGGIKPKNGRIIRPLLGVSKQEIMHFAQENALPFVTDSSNLQEDFTRNKIRLSLIPLLQSINPSIEESLVQTMAYLNEAGKIYDRHIQEAIPAVFDEESGRIHIPLLKTFPSPESILFELLKNYGFESERIGDIAHAIDSQSGKEFYSEHYRLVKDRDAFLLSVRTINHEPTTYLLSPTTREIQQPLKLRMRLEEITSDFQIKKENAVAYLDADILQFPFIVRKWKQGDKFVPFGMTHFKKLSDYFNDHKFSKPEKEDAWLLCSGNGDILWVIGHRTDNRYRITERTRRVCCLMMECG